MSYSISSISSSFKMVRSLSNLGCCTKEGDLVKIEGREKGGHDVEILLGWDVVESHCIPDRDVFVLDGPIPAHQTLLYIGRT